MDPDTIESRLSSLRHRPTATSPAPAPIAASAAVDQPDDQTPTSTTTAWDDQLVAARRAMAERVKKQMQDDGWEDGDVDAGSGPEAPAGHAAGLGDRRGSESSTASSDGEEEVRRMFSGGWKTPIVEEKEEGDVPVGQDEAQARAGAAPEREAGAADEPPAQAEGAGEEEKMCRICFDGEDPELGRLFSPCQCRGTSRFVHVKCLDRWRAASAGSAFYKCDQCGYEYKLRRTKIAGLAQNPIALSGVTIAAFTLLIFFAGFIANFILSAVDARAAAMRESGGFGDIFVSDYVIMGEGVREAVDFFGSTVDKASWSALKAAPANEEEEDGSSYRYFRSMPKKAQKEVKPTWARRTVEHFIKGLSLVGITSFAQMFFLGPFGLRGSLFRAVRPGRRREGDNAVSYSQIMLVLFVIVGAGKAIRQVYRGVRLKRILGKGAFGTVWEQLLVIQNKFKSTLDYSAVPLNTRRFVVLGVMHFTLSDLMGAGSQVFTPSDALGLNSRDQHGTTDDGYPEAASPMRDWWSAGVVIGSMLIGGPCFRIDTSKTASGKYGSIDNYSYPGEVRAIKYFHGGPNQDVEAARECAILRRLRDGPHCENVQVSFWDYLQLMDIQQKYKQHLDYAAIPLNTHRFVVLGVMHFTLKDLMRAGDAIFTPQMVRKVAHHIILGLNHLYYMGIVNRDIKPDNIFLAGNYEMGYRAELADFGVGYMKGELPSLSMAKDDCYGTLDYQPPEAVGWEALGKTRRDQHGTTHDGFPETSHPSRDWWSAGVVIGRQLPPNLQARVPWAKRFTHGTAAFELVQGLLQWDVAHRWDPHTALQSTYLIESRHDILRSAQQREVLEVSGHRVTKRARSSSIVSVQEIPENYDDSLDQGALTNVNADWVNYKGAWLIHVVLILSGIVLLDIIPGMTQDLAWTIVNMTYLFATYIVFHYVTGVPFDLASNSGVYDRLTLWEQIDSGAQYTPAKKWLTTLPIVLFLASTHYTTYDSHPWLFSINLISLVLVGLAPKLPYFHRLRFKFFEGVVGSVEPSAPPTPVEEAMAAGEREFGKFESS
ncbi:ORMDL family protein [Pseudohyphozyma bogoriensis]|nr:ORMDL family protein [Pseudohyphozyma bogoriensis]